MATQMNQEEVHTHLMKSPVLMGTGGKERGRLIGDIITPAACPICSRPEGEETPSDFLCFSAGTVPFSEEAEELRLREPTSSERMSDMEKDRERFPGLVNEDGEVLLELLQFEELLEL